MKSELGLICFYSKDKRASSSLTTSEYISTENMLPNRGGIIAATSIPSSGNVTAFNKGDVLVSNIRPYFKKVWKADFSGGCSNDVLVFRAKDGVDPDFLYAILLDDAFFEYSMSTAKGTKMPRGDKKAILHYPVEVPSPEAQKRIGLVINAIEGKIRNNKKINQNLLVEAQTIFDDGYDKENETVSLSTLVDIFGGGTPKTKIQSYWNGMIPFFAPGDATETFAIRTEKTITEEGLNNCNSRLYPAGTTFITARGTVGKMVMAGVPMAMNQSCFALKAKGLSDEMAFLYVRKSLRKLLGKANGAVFDALTAKDIREETVFRHAPNVERRLENLIEPLFDEILRRQFENEKLSRLRDSILPKLTSGEIDVDSGPID